MVYKHIIMKKGGVAMRNILIVIMCLIGPVSYAYAGNFEDGVSALKKKRLQNCLRVVFNRSKERRCFGSSKLRPYVFQSSGRVAGLQRDC